MLNVLRAPRLSPSSMPGSRTLLHSRGNGRITGPAIESRLRIVDTVTQHISRVISPGRLLLLDRALDKLEKDDDGHTALERGLYVVHATPMTDLQGGLLPKTFSFHDAAWPKTSVATLWFTSSIRRAIEHCADSHYSSMHAQGLRIILVGPGAYCNFHVKLVVPAQNRMTVGLDFVTTASLPPIAPAEPWNFGPDTMVIDVAGAMGATPWAVKIIHDSLLSGVAAATAIRVANETYSGLAKGCVHCDFKDGGCERCNASRGIGAVVENITPGIYDIRHRCHKLIGRRVRKLFEDQDGEKDWYEGTIHSYRRGLYKINHDDGDEEWLSDKQHAVTQILID